MAKTVSAGTYTVNSTATVYAASGSHAGTRRGSYKSGSSIKITGPITYGGNQYGIIAAGQTKGFTGYISSFTDPVGCMVAASVLQPKASGSSGMTPNKTEGVYLHTSVSFDVWVKSGANCAVWTDPRKGSQSTTGNKKSGEKMHIYAIAKTQDNRYFGYIDTALTKCIMIYQTGKEGTLSNNLSRTAPGTASSNKKTQPTPQTTAKQSLDSAKPTSMITGGATAVAEATTKAYDAAAAASSIQNMQFNLIDTDAESMRELQNMKSVLGVPPLLPESADPKYIKDLDFGRSYSEMFLMNNCIFSILPCKVRYLPGFSQDKKMDFLNLVSSTAGGFGEDTNIAGMSQQMGLSGQLFEAVQDYNNYIDTVNMLARVFAIYLGIGDLPCPGTNTSYKNADYTFYRRFSAASAGGTLFSSIGSFMGHVTEALVGKTIGNDQYTHFYMTADGTSMSDSMSVQTTASSIEGLFNNGLSELGKDIQFLMGGQMDEQFVNDLMGVASGLGSAVSAIPYVGTTLGNMFMYGANYLRGGRLVFPQMLDDCTYDRSYTGSCRFISPSGDPEARFMNCYLPLCFMLPYVLPQMLSDNMYTYPFVCKVDVPGQVHCDLAAVTGLRIQRGGPEGQSWTVDGLPFEIDITFDITPLYSKLMVTNTRHPVLFLSNTALNEYMASMAGVNFTGDELTLKTQIAMALFNPATVAKNYVGSLFRSYYDSGIANGLRWVFNF